MSAIRLAESFAKPRPIEQDLYSATSLGDIQWIREALLSPFVRQNVNKPNKCGWTLLMYAAYYGHGDILELLLQNGCDVNCQNTKKQTALMLASICGNEQCCLSLLNYEARVNDTDEMSWTPLVYAINSGHLSIVQLLVDHFANINIVTQTDKKTPLLMAAAAGHEPICRVLINSGADLYSLTASNKTPSMLAKEQGYLQLAKLFDSYNVLRKVEINFPNYPPPVSKSNLALSPNVKSLVSPYLLEPPFPTTLFGLLDILGLSQYFVIFEENGIDLKEFLKLKEENLKELGISKLGPRRKLGSAIARINGFYCSETADIKVQQTWSSSTFLGKSKDLENGQSCQGTRQEFLRNTCLDKKSVGTVVSSLFTMQLKNAELQKTLNNMKGKMECQQKKIELSGEIFSNIDEGLLHAEKLSSEINVEINNVLQYLYDGV